MHSALLKDFAKLRAVTFDYIKLWVQIQHWKAQDLRMLIDNIQLGLTETNLTDPMIPLATFLSREVTNRSHSNNVLCSWSMIPFAIANRLRLFLADIPLHRRPDVLTNGALVRPTHADFAWVLRYRVWLAHRMGDVYQPGIELFMQQPTPTATTITASAAETTVPAGLPAQRFSVGVEATVVRDLMPGKSRRRGRRRKVERGTLAAIEEVSAAGACIENECVKVRGSRLTRVVEWKTRSGGGSRAR